MSKREILEKVEKIQQIANMDFEDYAEQFCPSEDVDIAADKCGRLAAMVTILQIELSTDIESEENQNG